MFRFRREIPIWNTQKKTTKTTTKTKQQIKTCLLINLSLFIIMSHRISSTPLPFIYHPSLPAGLLDYILCLYRAVIDKFWLVGQHLLIHMKGSIGEHHLWVHPYFSSSVSCLIWMVLEMEVKWLYTGCFVRCCFQDLFSIAYSILVKFLSSFFSICLVNIHMVHPYSRMDMI